MTDALAAKAADPKAVLTGSAADAQRRHELSEQPAAPAGDALFAAIDHPARAAVPVLLDGADLDQAGQSAARSRHLQPVLDLESDVQAHLQAAVRNRISDLAVEHDAGRGLRDGDFDHRQRARRLCDRAAALQGRAVGRRRDLPRLSGAALDPVHPALDRRVPIRPVRHAVRADPDLSDYPDSVLDLAVDGLFQDHPVRARGMRADRRRQPLANPDPRSCCRWRCRG